MVTQMKHLLSLLEYNESAFVKVLELAEKIKSDWTKGKRPDLLPRKVLGLIFEKPSLRTRVSFESAMMQMGGNSVFLGTSDGQIGVRDSARGNGFLAQVRLPKRLLVEACAPKVGADMDRKHKTMQAARKRRNPGEK